MPAPDTPRAREHTGRPVILFDGVCNLCTAAVRFVIERDPGDRFSFASLQSETARQLLEQAGPLAPLPDSIVLLDAEGVHTRSDAALRIAAGLRRPWSLAAGLRIVPRALRDGIYDFVARRRYRWFGTRDTCLVPTPELTARFLDSHEPSPDLASVLPPTASSGSCGGHRPPGRVASAAHRWLLAYLFIALFPFPVGTLPWTSGLEESYQSFVQRFVSWVAQAVFGITITVLPNGSGDTTYSYIEILTFVVLALVCALGASLLQRGRPVAAHTRDLMRTYVRYYLATVLLFYGFHKVLPLQFPEPGPDRLIMSYGDSSPMGLLWTFMGASKPYMFFGGLGEVLGGLLLLWRRTTLLGALVAFGVLLNVVMLNFSYDVPVKLFSSLLLVLALFLVLPDVGRLVNLLVWNRPAHPATLRPFPIQRPWLRRSARVGKALMAVSIVAGSFWDNYQMLGTYGPGAPRRPLHGVYRVESFSRDGVADRELPDSARWVRVGINQDRSLAIQRADGGAKRYRVQIDTTKRTLALSQLDQPQPATFTYSEPTPGTLVVEGPFEGGQTRARLVRQPEAPFLLTSRGFRWINEYPFNR